MNTLLVHPTTAPFQQPTVATAPSAAQAATPQPAGTNWLPWLVGGAAVGAGVWWLLSSRR